MKWSHLPSSSIDCRKKVVEMYQKTYKQIGTNENWVVFDPIAEYYPCAFLLRSNDNECVGCILYWQSDKGNKIGLVFADSPEISKTYVIPKLVSLLQDDKAPFYVELSGTLEYIIRSQYNLENITNVHVLKELIFQLKEDDVFTKNDKRRTEYMLNPVKSIPSPVGSYIREIPAVGPHRKAMYGHPCLHTFVSDGNCGGICTTKV